MSRPIPHETPEARNVRPQPTLPSFELPRELNPYMEIIIGSDIEPWGYDKRRGTLAEYPRIVNMRVDHLRDNGARFITTTCSDSGYATRIEYRAERVIPPMELPR